MPTTTPHAPHLPPQHNLGAVFRLEVVQRVRVRAQHAVEFHGREAAHAHHRDEQRDLDHAQPNRGAAEVLRGGRRGGSVDAWCDARGNGGCRHHRTCMYTIFFAGDT